MNEEKTTREWIKENKTELICGGIAIVAVAGIILGVKNRDVIKPMFKGKELLPKELPSSADMLTIVTPIAEINIPPTAAIKRAPHDVTRHLRQLPEGYKTSAEKIAVATKLGYALQPGQTLVEAYRTGQKAA